VIEETLKTAEETAATRILDRRGKPFTLRRCNRYRLYPTKKQETILLEQMELCRRLYNKALWKRKGIYERAGLRVTYAEQCRWLPGLKKEIAAYAAISSGVLENVLKRTDLAFRGFFRRVKAKENPGYPRAKATGAYKSLTVPRSREFKVVWDGNGRFGRLSFKGLSGVRVRMHRPLSENAAVRRVTIKREGSGRWYAIFGWDVKGYEVPEHPWIEESVGLHPGLAAYLSTDCGKVYEPHKTFERHRGKLAKRQLRLSRKKKGSRRREKARILVARQHEKIRDSRRDRLHKLSRELVDRYGQIFANRFDVRGMASGDGLKPLRAKVLDAAWSELLHMLRFKAEKAGGVYVEVEAKNAAQECSGYAEKWSTRTSPSGCIPAHTADLRFLAE
jgi:putative transposase